MTNKTLDPVAVKNANNEFFKRHPERNGQPITPAEVVSNPALVKEWKLLYEKEAKLTSLPPPSNKKPSKPTVLAPKISSKGACLSCGNTFAAPEYIPEPGKPCDIEKLKLKCSHCPSTTEDNVRTLKHLIFESKKNSIAPPRVKGREDVDFLEVVAYEPLFGPGDKITVEVESTVGYQCDKEHPHILVFEVDDSYREVKSSPSKGNPKLEFEARPRSIGDVLLGGNILEVLLYFFGQAQYRSYEVQGGACGRRSEGDPVGSIIAYVRVYPADKYKLVIPFLPAPWKRTKKQESKKSWDGKKESESSETVTEKALKGEKSKESEKTTTTYSDTGNVKVTEKEKGGTFLGTKTTDMETNDDLAPLYGKPQTTYKDDYLPPELVIYEPVESNVAKCLKEIEFTRNGKDVEVGFLEILKLLINIKKEIAEALELLESVKPSAQIGYDFETEISVLEGKISISWQYREWKDHLCWLWWEIEANLTLIDASLEVSFGIDFEWKKIRACLKVFGKGSIDFSQNFSGCHDNPETGPILQNPKTSVEQATQFGIKLVLGADWANATGSLTLTNVLSAEWQMPESDRGFGLEIQLGHKGLKSQIIISKGLIDLLKVDWVIIEEMAEKDYKKWVLLRS